MLKSTRRKLLSGIAGGLAWLGATGAIAQTADKPIVLQWQTANLTEKQFEPVWKEMVAAFEAANPGIKIDPVLVARKDHWTKFVTASQARRAPCLVSVDLTTAAYNGYLMPLDKFWDAEPEAWRKAWSEEVMKAARWQGKLYGVPIWGGIYAEIYNEDLVKAAGLDPAKPPVSWADYRTWAKALTKDGQWATAILGGKTDTTTRVLLSWIYSNGGEVFNADMTEATFAKNPKSLEAIKAYLGLARDGFAAPAPTTTNYLEQTVMFAQNKIATMRNANWAIAKAEEDNPALKGKLIVAPAPHQIPNAPTLKTVTSTSIAADCASPEAAWKFIKFEADAKWSIKRAKVANWMPIRSDLANEPEIKSDPMLLTFLKIGENAKPYPLPLPIWADIAAGDIVDAVQKALLAPDTLETVFKDLDAKINRKLKDQ
ncbi:MAG: sugar ABC transporter substrate-binding protein [Chelatococcus sp.]|uniref:ABC transporter substrate-binding protein n=1 Tax=Chelatococcus sp. TaxID=1953771 RepID=UPI0025C1CE27|nr:sugar ABC transporter substrate-binding protein [Chelatococcus sp.]MBX3538483.1 sugar ABC transporter substrate-binding protein [Chelatococcus sp.]